MANLDILSDIYVEQAQNNAVVYQSENMDRVGVEPTTSAKLQLPRLPSTFMRISNSEENMTAQIPSVLHVR